ncbi:hypothetical protein SLEP1_g9729 [Rubroshorea leprosula]|uniref:Uncharacterized protein n=1 Tax=Rubroshorea leprosula TaxID=152421 RepID=A0AAV5IFR2_9ROSI|nr:hypothetical protein SLEP1_g9729 [Rubroshorea leprosula]
MPGHMLGSFPRHIQSLKSRNNWKILQRLSWYRLSRMHITLLKSWLFTYWTL